MNTTLIFLPWFGPICEFTLSLVWQKGRHKADMIWAVLLGNAIGWVTVSLYIRVLRDFPGGPLAKTLHSWYRGPRCNPWSGNWTPHSKTKSPHAAVKISHATTKIRRSTGPAQKEILTLKCNAQCDGIWRGVGEVITSWGWSSHECD